LSDEFVHEKTKAGKGTVEPGGRTLRERRRDWE